MHSKTPHGGQIHAGIRKKRNREERDQRDQNEATALGISPFALYVRRGQQRRAVIRENEEQRTREAAEATRRASRSNRGFW